MHELSIAMSIVDIASEEVVKAGGGKVTEVVVNIGSLSGIVADALLFSWDIAAKNTIADKSTLIINQIEARAECTECRHVFAITEYMAKCTECGSYIISIISGKEMRVESILVD